MRQRILRCALIISMTAFLSVAYGQAIRWVLETKTHSVSHGTHGYLYKSLNLMKGDYLIGQVRLLAQDINCHITTPEGLANFQEEEPMPSSSLLWSREKCTWVWIMLKISKAGKYYLILDNRYSTMTDKSATIWLMAISNGYRVKEGVGAGEE